MALLVIRDNEQSVLTLAPKTARGNPARIDGVPTWAVSDPTILAVEPAADGLTATVRALGPAGAGQVSAEADADLGAGVVLIAGRLDVEVFGQASVLDILATPPVPQPVV